MRIDATLRAWLRDLVRRHAAELHSTLLETTAATLDETVGRILNARPGNKISDGR